MPCWKCSAELEGAKKFCGQCGAAVDAKAVDPFASTAQPQSRKPKGSGLPPSGRVSPLASSSIEFHESVREIVVSARAESPVNATSPASAPPSERVHAGTLQMKQSAPRPPPAAPAASSKPSSLPPSVGVAAIPGGLEPGVAVRVRWANGQKYAGTVWQVHANQVLVAFQDGQRHWVEASFVERS